MDFLAPTESPVAFIGIEDEVISVAGQKVILKCQVTGHPTPTVTWTRPDHASTPVTPEDPRMQVMLNEYHHFLSIMH